MNKEKCSVTLPQAALPAKHQPTPARLLAFVQGFFSSLHPVMPSVEVSFDGNGNPYVTSEVVEHVAGRSTGAETMWILVKMLDDAELHAFGVKAEDTVAMLKSLIQESLGILPRKQRLVVPFRRALLDEETNL
jgi:hypothetical protein